MRLAALVLALATAATCVILDDDPPTNTCKADADCFRAQGEVCDLGSHRCVPGDAGVDGP